MRRFALLRCDLRGIAALEFALCAPLLVLLLVVAFQTVTLLRQDSRLEEAGQALGEILAQQTTISAKGSLNTPSDMCAGAAMILSPLAAKPFAAAIASVTNAQIGGVVQPHLDWEIDSACQTTAAALGSSAVTLATSPTNLIPATGDSVIIVRVSYKDGSIVSSLLPGGALLTRTLFSRPRLGTTVPCTSC